MLTLGITLTNLQNYGDAYGPEKDEHRSVPNVLALALTMASAMALILTLLGSGVSYAVESSFGLPHASIFESALDLTDLSGYAIAQLLNHGFSMLFDWSLYGSMYGRGWPTMLAGFTGSILVWVFAWRWGLRPQKRSLADRSRKPASTNCTRAKELRSFALASAFAFPLMPIIGAMMIGAVCALCALVAFAPMIGMVAGESYVKEWVIDPTLCMPVRTREIRLHADMASADAGKLPKVSSCVVVSKDGLETARGRVILMTTKSAALFDPATGVVRRIPITDSVVEVVPNLDARAATVSATASLAAASKASTRSASDARHRP